MIQLNRPKALNALNQNMAELITKHMQVQCMATVHTNVYVQCIIATIYSVHAYGLGLPQYAL